MSLWDGDFSKMEGLTRAPLYAPTEGGCDIEIIVHDILEDDVLIEVNGMMTVSELMALAHSVVLYFDPDVSAQAMAQMQDNRLDVQEVDLDGHGLDE